MNLEKHLHLFTRVEDGLPEEDGNYLCIKYNPHFGGYIIIGVRFEKHQGFLSGSKVTHWLDLDKLTTKEAALKLVDKAFCFGYEYSGDISQGCRQEDDNILTNFINQNKDKLWNTITTTRLTKEKNKSFL